MNRRSFLRKSTVVAAAPLSAAAATAAASVSLSDGQPTIDVNVYLDRWPFRRLPLDQTAVLAGRLKECGINHAWAGSFEALLHRDLDAVNDRLVSACRSDREAPFKPFGAVNPNLPDWRETLRRCAEDHRMTGIRLHPNFHGYALDDPEFLALLAEAKKRNLIVQIAVRMEDTEARHPLLQVDDVDPAPLLSALPDFKGLRLQLLNALSSVRDPLVLSQLAGMGVQFDIGMVEGAAGIETLLKRGVPLTALTFGSYAPRFPVESALLNLKESALSAGQSVAIRCHNVENLLALA